MMTDSSCVGAFRIIKLFISNPVRSVVTYHGPSYALPNDLWNRAGFFLICSWTWYSRDRANQASKAGNKQSLVIDVYYIFVIIMPYEAMHLRNVTWWSVVISAYLMCFLLQSTGHTMQQSSLLRTCFSAHSGSLEKLCIAGESLLFVSQASLIYSMYSCLHKCAQSRPHCFFGLKKWDPHLLPMNQQIGSSPFKPQQLHKACSGRKKSISRLLENQPPYLSIYLGRRLRRRHYMQIRHCS